MKIAFHGAAKEVGRSCITVNNQYMLDCGLKIEQHECTYPQLNYGEEIKAVLLSHAHLDHTGALPLFNHNGLRCSIYCTSMTKVLTKILLKDSLHIEQLSKKHPAYSEENIWNVMSFIQKTEYRKTFRIGDNVKATFLDAGHIPGSSSVLLEFKDKKLLYSGDINTINTRLMHGLGYHVYDVDVLITESTYGDRNHDLRQETEKQFLEKVKEGINRNGVVLAPAFAVGRAQEILMVLKNLDLDVPIYLDGMAKSVTELFSQNPNSIRNVEELKQAMHNVNFVQNHREREDIVKEPCIIVTTSGMVDGGPVMDYIKYVCHDPNNMVLLTGYQAEHTNGRRLLEKKSAIVDNKQIKLSCPIHKFDFSAHAGQKELLEFVNGINPKHVILNHGDEPSIKEMKKKLKDYDVYDPNLGEEIKL